MKRFSRAFLAVPIVLSMLSLPALAGPSTTLGPSTIKDEHLRPVPRGQHIARTVNQFPVQMPVVQVGHTASVDLSNAFLTRPYMNYHFATSIFDHCNPDYSTDGRICDSGGGVALKSNGVDPSFSLGYAQTPGGADYLYYDGHNGWDIALNYENVMAAADGVVRIAGIDSVNPCFGTNIVIDHPNGFSTRYAHLSQLYVSIGQSVSRGQVIGQSGNTGCSSGPHLHFGVYVSSSWTAIDPFGWTGAPGADPWPADQGNLWFTGNPQNPLPWAPTNVTAVAGFRAANVSWTAPGFDGGSGIANYTVTAAPGGASAVVPGNQTTATVNGLSNGTAYTFTVMATDGLGGIGTVSSASNSVVPTDLPGQPTGVNVSPANQGVTLSWTAPSNSGGTPITGYKIAATSGSAGTTVGTVTNASISGLSGTSALSFTVSAINSNGTGLPSAPSNAVVPYPVAQLFSLDAYGGVHPDAATAAESVSAYWPGWKIAKSAVLLSDGSGGYVLDGFGGVHPFGAAGTVATTAYWNGWNIARDLVLLPGTFSGHGEGYVLDGFGALHPFGGAPGVQVSAYWSSDLGRRAVMLSDGTGGYVMDAYGGLHPFAVGSNSMPPTITNYAYWSGWKIARDIALLPGSTAGNVAGVTLDGYGGVHPFGTAGSVTSVAYWPNWDIARSVVFAPTSTAANPQGWVMEGYGGLHPFGGAPNLPGAYWPNNDVGVKLLVR